QLNGQVVGPIHQGGFYQFEYNITEFIRPGKTNVLEVEVAKYSADETVNDAERRADYWIFGGIFRPVYLKAFPQSHIHRMAIDAKADGHLVVDILVEEITEPLLVVGKVFDLNGQQLGESFKGEITAGDSVVRLAHQFLEAKSWSPEWPSLYEIELSLQQEGQIIHQHTERFGFRTVELRARDGIYVNGKRVMFKGVNRHSFWPESGRTTSKALSIADVKLMKDMNMNAVRMSHYPPDIHFLDVCDSLGLFVLDELAGWQQEYGTEVGRKLVRELVIRDVNHPSVIIWDNGNEGGNNFELDDDFAKYDPQNRIVIHPWNQFRGTDTYHYKPYDCCANAFFHSKEVFFPTEFLHGLYDGGHGAGLEDYWTLMKQKRLSAGGFLWVFSDEAVLRTDQDSILDSDGNHAPDGILGPYREKEGSFYAIKDIWSPIQIPDFPLTDDFNGAIPLQNDFIYTNLYRCRFRWELIKYWDMGHKNPVVDSGLIDGPDIGPGQSGVLQLPISHLMKGRQQTGSPDFLALEAWDPHGRQIYRWTWPLNAIEKLKKKSVAMAAIPPHTYSLGKDSIYTARSRQTGYAFDLTTGLLKEVKVNGQRISLGEGPVPV
ncbi:MAG: glycoside hydrolase family 2 TIM barrel-domain containing protein, partial [Bacteroidota bacterium]